MGFFDKIKQGLSKTRDALSNTLGNIFTGSEIDDDFYEELEESLILADLGVETSVKAAELLRKKVKENHLKFNRHKFAPGLYDSLRFEFEENHGGRVAIQEIRAEA